MKKSVILFLGLLVLAPGCQTRTELTNSAKDNIVKAVKEKSQQYWGMNGKMDPADFQKYLIFFDEKSDNAWQTEPVTVIFNTRIINTYDEWIASWEEMFGNRIAMTMDIVESYFNVLSEEKVLEVNKVDYTITSKDSIVHGPYTGVNTVLWVNVRDDWKMQFFHESYAKQIQ